MAITKDEILLAIKREAAANDGVPLGKRRFEVVSGIRESQWSGRYWARWNDALAEAGFEPNAWNSPASTEEELLAKLATLAKLLGHYPVSSERKLHRNKDETFPWPNTFEERLGNRESQLAKLRDFALVHEEFSEVYDMVTPLMPTTTTVPTTKQLALGVIGSVYLMRSGIHHKIGRSNHVGRRSYEVALQLPEKLEIVHEIETDDPEGIERYWHERFSAKRANGEWFNLTDADVAVFRRRKTFM